MSEKDYVDADANEVRKHNILAMSFAEVAERLEEDGQDVVLIPLGSTEKHGAHIPLGTDSYVTMEVVERTARAADVMYSPLVPFGYSPHHMGRHLEGAGTVTLRAETYRRVMNDVARSLIYHGFRKILFVSHHGSNTKPIDEIMRQLRYETGAYISYYKTPTERDAIVVQDLFDNPPEETPGWHSSELETSVLMATADGLVDMDRAVEDRAHAPSYMTDAFSKTDGTATHDRAANDAFVTTLRARLSSRVRLHEMEVTINDPVFANTAAEILLELLENRSEADVRTAGVATGFRAL